LPAVASMSHPRLVPSQRARTKASARPCSRGEAAVEVADEGAACVR
jgi:hypothetical protein